MASKNIEINIPIRTEESGKSLSELRNEFKSIQRELSNTKIGTEEYYNTLKKLGNVRGEIKDLNDAINNLDPGNKAQVFGSVISGLAGGIQAATGAMSLFGVESEEVQKTMLMLQAASNLAAGIQSVMELGKAFQALKVILMQNPIMLIGSILATAGVAIYGLVKALDDTEDRVKRVKNAQDGLKEATESSTNAIENQIKIQKAQGKDTYDLEMKKLEILKTSALKQIDMLEKIRKTRGKLTEEELKELKELKKHVENINTDIEASTIEHNKKLKDEDYKKYEKYKENLKKHQEELKKNLDEQLKDIEFNTNERLKFADKESKEDVKINIEALTLKKQAVREYYEQLKILEKNNKLIDKSSLKEAQQLITSLSNDLKILTQDYINFNISKQNEQESEEQKSNIKDSTPTDDKNKSELPKLLENELNIIEQYKNDEIEIYAETEMDKLDIQINAEEKKLAILEDYKNRGVDVSKKYIEIENNLIDLKHKKEIESAKSKESAIKELKKDSINYTKQISDSLFTFLNNINSNDVKKQKELARKKFAVDKALNSAQAVMNTATAISKALTSPPPFNFILAGIVGAMGAAQIMAIASTKFNEGSDVSSETKPSIPSTSAGLNTDVGSVESNILNPLTPNGMDIQHDEKGNVKEQQIRAYVVEQDIRDNLNKKDLILSLSGY